MTKKKNSYYLQHGMTIAGLLEALARTTREAASIAEQAHQASNHHNQNLAVGTLLPIRTELEKAQALLQAVMTLHHQ